MNNTFTGYFKNLQQNFNKLIFMSFSITVLEITLLIFFLYLFGIIFSLAAYHTITSLNIFTLFSDLKTGLFGFSLSIFVLLITLLFTIYTFGLKILYKYIYNKNLKLNKIFFTSLISIFLIGFLIDIIIKLLSQMLNLIELIPIIGLIATVISLFLFLVKKLLYFPIYESLFSGLENKQNSFIFYLNNFIYIIKLKFGIFIAHFLSKLIVIILGIYELVIFIFLFYNFHRWVLIYTNFHLTLLYILLSIFLIINISIFVFIFNIFNLNRLLLAMNDINNEKNEYYLNDDIKYIDNRKKYNNSNNVNNNSSDVNNNSNNVNNNSNNVDNNSNNHINFKKNKRNIYKK